MFFSTVTMNYQLEALRQSNDSKFYKPLSTLIKRTINNMRHQGFNKKTSTTLPFATEQPSCKTFLHATKNKYTKRLTSGLYPSLSLSRFFFCFAVCLPLSLSTSLSTFPFPFGFSSIQEHKNIQSLHFFIHYSSLYYRQSP